ncbi:site-specific integrase [Cupriavidus campinensis]|uniref:Site-specific integrase n=1 Tax=Cupriavidus campinensis TaxID=151783 RepID=A0ABY3EI91_9BURK|nr:site-specific integrase [Cupriavidus campinensis]TSP10640.1 site-specific integrase [Cupriavidus campinensis]
MGTITQRARKDGSIGYTAQIRLKQGGVVVFTEAKTFDRRPAAKSWLEKRERELAQPGAMDAAKQEDPTLAEVIRKLTAESTKDIGRTKAQVLRTIANSDLGRRRCSQIGSADIVAYARSLEVLPQTAGNYMAHLSSVFSIARPAWGYPLNEQAMADARKVLGKLGAVSRSKRRDRRPTLDELDKLLDHFVRIRAKRIDSNDMAAITAFAIFSTRRQEEITRLTYEDLDVAHSRIMVRDMKHPGEKVGNDQWCDLPPEALRIIKAQPHETGRIFRANSDAISAAFTRACQFLAIEDLHFHDLRHEGASRLFEMGLTIPHVAAVTGHRSWASLQRYTHLRHTGDRFAGWKWLDTIAPAPQPAA